MKRPDGDTNQMNTQHYSSFRKTLNRNSSQPTAIEPVHVVQRMSIKKSQSPSPKKKTVKKEGIHHMTAPKSKKYNFMGPTIGR